MSLSVCQNAVACNHRQRILQGCLNYLLRHREYCNHSALLSITFEALLRESFTGCCPLQISIINSEDFLPTLIEDGGLNVGHAGDVGITLSRDVEISRPCFADHFE